MENCFLCGFELDGCNLCRGCEKKYKKSTKLLLKNGAAIVGVGIKQVGGQDTGRHAILVGVKKKLPLTELATLDIIPQSVEGFETDVIEVGEIKLL